MNERASLLPLYLATATIWTVGNGVVPLIPIHASDLGLAPSAIGALQAGFYASVIVGTLTGGRLVRDRRSASVWMQVGAVGGGLCFLWLGLVPGVAALVLGHLLGWYLLGMTLCLAKLTAGAMADPERRTTALVVLAGTSAVGALLGGAFTGALMDRYGFGTLCLVLSGLCFVAVAWVRTVPGTDQGGAVVRINGRGRFEWASGAAVASMFLLSVAAFTCRFSLPLVMDASGATAHSVSLASALAAGACLVLIGALQFERMRRLRPGVLVACATGPALGLWMLSGAKEWGDYALASSGVSAFNFIGAGLAAGVLVAKVSKRVRSRRLVAFTSAGWGGGLVGYGLAGLSLEHFGLAMTLDIGIGLGSVGAVGLVGALLLLHRHSSASSLAGSTLSGHE